MLWSLRKYGLYAALFGILYFLFTMYAQIHNQEHMTPVLAPLNFTSYEHDQEFLLNTKKCRIPNVNPWNFETEPLYVRKRYERCSDKKALTRIVYDIDDVFLEIDHTAKSDYGSNDIACCYCNISSGGGDTPDLDIRVSPCRQFENKVRLHEVSVFVKCRDMIYDVDIYSNTHSLLPKTVDIKGKIKLFEGKSKPPSILLIGIDSMSRLNFHRMLLKTNNYLQRNGWLEYKGYNKIGDNTLPNLMALLTGKNLSTVLEECDPRERIENCNFIWKVYNSLGYISAYGEDETSISTFTTYSFKGFREKPVDYYYMPYLIASEKLLDTKRLDGMTYCAGSTTSAERVLNIAKDLMSKYLDHPKFGFFWMNSFSHEDINAPARVDERFMEFFSQLQTYLENTIVIFFSDHGIRFGEIRVTRSGWLEERLPFLYFWVPQALQKKFPKEAANLKANAVKLTTPYDIYMTLQHVLVLYDLNYIAKPSEACQNCRSLFTYFDERSCEDASIQFHWCTCFGYANLNPSTAIALAAAQFAVKEINNVINSTPEMYLRCSQFSLKRIISAGISANNIYNKTFLLLIFETLPRARYEVTVSVHSGEDGQYFLNEGSTSRLDRYEATSSCIDVHKMYCYCRWQLQWQMNFFSFWFEI